MKILIDFGLGEESDSRTVDDLKKCAMKIKKRPDQKESQLGS